MSQLLMDRIKRWYVGELSGEGHQLSHVRICMPGVRVGLDFMELCDARMVRSCFDIPGTTLDASGTIVRLCSSLVKLSSTTVEGRG
jgi:hypothetical protein